MGGDNLELALYLRDEIAAQQELIEEERREVARLRGRIEKGQAWFRRHGEEHSKYAHNRELLDRLQWALDIARWAVRDARVRLMGLQMAFWAAYDALTPIERQAVAADGIERPDPERYWQAVNNWQEIGA